MPCSLAFIPPFSKGEDQTKHMKITANQYAELFYELTVNKAQAEISAIVSNFLEVLAKNRQMKLADKIIEKFSEIYNKKNGIVEAEITSCEVLSNELRNKVSNYVSTKYQAKEVILNNKIDLKIKGGIVIKVGDDIMDASIERSLVELKNVLVK